MDLENFRKAIDSSGMGQQILIWGAREKNEHIRELFQNWGFSVCGYIGRRHVGEEYKGLEIFGRDILSEKRFFVYVGLDWHYNDVIATMEQNGYIEFRDFWYPARVVELDGTENYSDAYGNSLITSCATPVKVILKNGGEVKLGKCRFAGNCAIRATRNGRIQLGDGTKFGWKCFMQARDSSIAIGEKCSFGSQFAITCISKAEIKIENLCTATSSGIISAHMNTKVILGQDCMLSNNVLIRAGNGHNIFDLNTNENLDTNDRRDVVIGEHVWLGMRTTILNGAKIGSGSVVGANTFINKEFPENCSIAGNPARIIRNGIAWRRENDRLYDTYEDFASFDFRT